MYPDNMSRSARLFERATESLPGGNTRHTVFFPPYPIYAASGEGATVTDVDGVTYLDFMNNASAAIHGHCHPAIVAAIREQAGRLISVCLPTELEIRLAEILRERLPALEQVRFCNSGSEAVMFALKAARAFTGRPKIAKIEGAYHGAYDPAEASISSRPDNWGDPKHPAKTAYSFGTPANMLADVVVLPFNDVDASAALLEENREQLAAVLVDPLISRMAFTRATPEYLKMLRRFCDESGAVLIFDEVFSFRMGPHGAQGEVGIAPDLTALGKVIGGGLPIGAFGGRKSIMSVFDQRHGHPKAPHGGTFNGNPLTMAAGIKSLKLSTPAAYAELARLGDKVRAGINDAFQRNGIEGQARGYASMTAVLLSRAQFSENRGYNAAAATNKRFPEIHRYLLEHGILVMPSGGILLSTPMTDTDIDRLLDTFQGALRAYQSKRAA